MISIKKINILDLSAGKEELVALYGLRGQIAHDLVRREGCAVWIPDFVDDLFKNYIVLLKGERN